MLCETWKKHVKAIDQALIMHGCSISKLIQLRYYNDYCYYVSTTLTTTFNLLIFNYLI
jgi:hypothetical protein